MSDEESFGGGRGLGGVFGRLADIMGYQVRGFTWGGSLSEVLIFSLSKDLRVYCKFVVSK